MKSEWRKGWFRRGRGPPITNKSTNQNMFQKINIKVGNLENIVYIGLSWSITPRMFIPANVKMEKDMSLAQLKNINAPPKHQSLFLVLEMRKNKTQSLPQRKLHSHDYQTICN